MELAESVAMAKILQAKKEAAKAGKATLSKKEQEKLNLLKEVEITAHKESPNAIASKYEEMYGVDTGTLLVNGLTNAQAAIGIQMHGINQLTPPKSKPEWLKCLETQKGFFNLLLWAGSLLCFISYGLDQSSPDNLYLGIVLAVVVVTTGTFEYCQEKSSSDLMKKFANMLPPAVQCKRNGEFQATQPKDLTLGDIVKINNGDKLPADVRVITASAECKVQQSSLTGEPDALKRSNLMTHPSYLETENLMFFGTLCTSGNAECIVIGIGDDTVMGSISRLTTSTVAEQTPISKEIDHFIFIVAGVAMFLGISFFVIGVVKDYLGTGTVNWTTQLVFMIGIIVANVPEGLLATVTVCLTLTAKRMAKKNVLVKNLESVETLGSTSCICSDKTGTLTQNKMTVTNIAVDGKIFEFKYASTEGTNVFPMCDSYTNGDLTGRVVGINDPPPGREVVGTTYDIQFDKGAANVTKLGLERGWITNGMLSKNGQRGSDSYEAGTPLEVSVGDEVQVSFSADSTLRLARVCALQNDATWEPSSRVIGEKNSYTEATRRKLEKMHPDAASWPQGRDVKFRFREELSGGQVQFLMDFWRPSENASSQAMVRWCQDKPLFSEAAYAAANVVAPAPFNGDSHLKDSYDQAAVDYENAMPGMDAYKAAYPKCSYTKDDSDVVWEIPFNSKNKFAASVHVQEGNREKPALLLMKGGSDVVMERCDHVMHMGQCVPFTPELKARYLQINKQFGNMGRRVLACAELELDVEKMPPNWEGFRTEVTIANFPLGTPIEKAEKDAEQLRAANAAAVESKSEPPHPEEFITEMLEVATQKLVFLGFTALIDPFRPSVPGAVAKCHSAGIKVVMVTGDHPDTARAIAKEVGIIHTADKPTFDDRQDYCEKTYGVKTLEWGTVDADNNEWWNEFKNSEAFKGSESIRAQQEHPWNDRSVRENEDRDYAPAIVLHGSQFSVETPTEWWDDVLNHQQVVFARTSPKQKLLIVKNFQQRGKIVAVTGDGVNDAPALKKADIGVAMGIAGTEVSKDAADMILLDDNFASIVNGIEEGRLIFDNLKKSIAYTLSSNIPEIAPFLSFITIGLPLPLSTVLILCIDLGTDMVPAISMAWENAEADIMDRAPRKQDTDRLVTAKLVAFAYLQIGIIQATAGFFSYIVVLGDYGYVPHILPGLGADDAWGKQLLMCKVTGGVLRNQAGHPMTAVTDIQNNITGVNDAFAKGYFFWDWNVDSAYSFDGSMDGFSNGEIHDCVHAPRTLNGGDAPDGFDWGKPLNFPNLFAATGTAVQGATNTPDMGSFTAGRPTAAINHILALKKQGYIEYQPFGSRMSSFYDFGWQAWAPKNGQGIDSGISCSSNNVATIIGFGDAGDAIHFTALPAGYRVIPPWTQSSESTNTWSPRALEAISDLPATSGSWLGNRKLGKTDGSGNVVWSDDLFVIPQYANGYTSSSRRSIADTVRGAASNRCTSFTSTNSSELDITYNADCTSTEWALADPLYSWVDTTSPENPVLRQNILNRMLQTEALKYAQTSGFTTIIVVQWADLMICKTRWLSIRQQGMRNNLMNFGLLFETILGSALCYIPFINIALQTRPLRFTHWFPGMPFCIIIFLYDETRKFLMRSDRSPFQSKRVRNPETGRSEMIHGWVGRNTYY